MRKERRDGVRIRDLDGFHSIVPYIMPKRTEAEVSMTEVFDVTELMDYLKDRNEKEGLKLKFFHAFCTAVARTIYLRPMMNIFIAGRAFWQRKGVSLSFVAKKEFEDGAEEALMFLNVKPDMNIDSISKKITGDVGKVRETKGNELDKLMRTVGKLPRWFLNIFFWVIRKMEYHGCVPRFLTDGDPNYSTALLSNLGSIKAGAPYHHLSEYGTCSIMITIGTVHSECCTNADGSSGSREVVEATFTLDERIADGFYFAKSLRIVKYLLEHPGHLIESMETPVPVEL